MRGSKHLLIALVMAGILVSCATGYRKLGWIDSGYQDTKIEFNTWLVSYHGGNLDFCKKAALYRAAQLCKEQGFAYFKIKSEQVRSTFMARSHSPLSDPRDNPGYVVENTSGFEKKYAVAGYNYRVEFLKTRPESGDAMDADELIKREGVPGAEPTKK